MPLTKTGEKVKRQMVKRYGKKRGTQIFYATIQAGRPGTAKWHRKTTTRVKGHYRLTNGKRTRIKAHKRNINPTYDKRQLAIGRKTEREHTNNPKVAEKIAKDHLREDKRYYTKLKRCGL